MFRRMVAPLVGSPPMHKTGKAYDLQMSAQASQIRLAMRPVTPSRR